MGRLTFERPDGTWGIAEMNKTNEADKLYLVAAKLHAYEKSGLSPYDLEDLCVLINEYSRYEKERLTTANGDGTYHYPECFRRCEGMVDSPCSLCDESLKRCDSLGRYEDSGLTTSELKEVARIIGRAVPCEKKMTRADAIRALSDEELAEMILAEDGTTLSDYWCRTGCPKAYDDTLDCGREIHCVLKWLREEVSGREGII